MELISKYRKFVSKVRDDHQAAELFGGHDFAHALRVGLKAYDLLVDEGNLPPVCECAFAAGLCHNYGRIVQKEWGVLSDQTKEVQKMTAALEKITPSLSFSAMMAIERAVLRHSRPNDDDDTLVAMALKDADRLVNCEPDVLFRIGQNYPNVPAIDWKLLHGWKFGDPQVDYDNPTSCLRDLCNVLVWLLPSEGHPQPQFALRLPSAHRKAAELRTFWEEHIEKMYRFSGLLRPETLSLLDE